MFLCNLKHAKLNREKMIEIDGEKIGKVVGRSRPVDSFAAAMKLQKAAQKLQSHLTARPKGVFRFKTHIEADQWLMRWMSRRRPRTN